MSDVRKSRALPDQDTLSRQAVAASPDKSVWVSANAGSGKTYVLATRVIRLLLSGTDPSRILCLTYTKTAAAEMKDRVFARLGEWVAMPRDWLAAILLDMEGIQPDAKKIAYARCLFARALETPGGLKIQTIHAFCDALLHRFPLEANVPGHFEQLDDDMIAALIGQARAEMLAHIEDGETPHVAEAFNLVIEKVGESGLESLLDEAVSNRSKLTSVLRWLDAGDNRREAYLHAFGFDAAATPASLAARIWPLPEFGAGYTGAVGEVGSRHGKANVSKVADGLRGCEAEDDPVTRLDLLVKIFLKADGAPKTHNMFPAAVLAELPDYENRFMAVAARVAEICDRVRLLEQVDNTLAALTIVDRLLAGYERLKRKRGYLDFDDLIERTANLLSRPDVGAWVRYKLDQGIDHILVDEAQDTSPVQWEVIRALSDEFFAGEAARDVRRTLFAVGDEKQSIYSFQGADPASFGEAGEDVKAKAEGTFGKGHYEDVPLWTSFRSTGDVLAAVDKVFALDSHRKGLSYGTGKIEHRSLRTNQPGWVEIWPVEKASDEEEQTDWTAPVDTPPQPSVVVAERVASVIADWLANGERLEATGEKVTPGDILILVRNRDAFVATVSRALKTKGIPVAGADRLKMTDHIAVLDLLAVAKFVLQPGDDLSLAALLKSPFFDLTEEQLFDLAHTRGKATLFEAIEKSAEADRAMRAVNDTLTRWRVRSRQMPVYEFYASILAGENGRNRLVARLGPETPDMLDEFMQFALAQERAGLPSLQNFVSVLESSSPVIKREMDQARTQVRIMTVHGAKGLEAPVVFLIDRGSDPHSSQKEGRFLSVPFAGEETGLLWNGVSAVKSSVTETARSLLREKSEEEYRRLLYVGMTRAADRLIVAGYAGKRGGKPGTWREMVELALGDDCVPVAYPNFEAKRYQVSEPVHVEPADRDAAAATAPVPLPDWFAHKVRPEPPLPRPLAPSGASGISVEPDRESSGPATAPSLLDAGTGGDQPPSHAIRRGIAMHRLLQMLPAVQHDQRREKAEAYCRRYEKSWDETDIERMVGQALSILDDPAHAPLFGPQSAAEAPIMGTLSLGGEKRAVSGVIDRIAVAGDRVLIIDYKTNARPARSVEEVPDVYVRQMALYRALVQPLYPGREVAASLLFTSGPVVVDLPAVLLDETISAFNSR